MTEKLSRNELEKRVKELEKDFLESHKIKMELFRIKRAIETTGDAIGVTDSHGDLIYQNKALTELFGYTAEELKEAGGPTVLYESQHVAEEVFETIVKGKSWHGEIEMVSRIGRKFPVSLHADAIFDDAGKHIGVIGIHRDITEVKQAEEERERLIGELQKALDNINTLEGLLPICSECKKIRDDKGYWKQIEGYIETHSNALFSHGLCPECMDKIYGDEDWYKKGG